MPVPFNPAPRDADTRALDAASLAPTSTLRRGWPTRRPACAGTGTCAPSVR